MPKILVDEMCDGLGIRLAGSGYDVLRVKQIVQEDPKMAHDYNILQYAERHDMILLTRDTESARACRANGIRCVCIDEDLVFGVVTGRLDSMCGSGA